MTAPPPIRRALTRARNAPRELQALLAVTAVLGVAWAVVLVPFQGPDEITHFNYAQQLAETGKAPVFEGGTGIVSTELGRALDWSNLRSTIGIPGARPAQTRLEERVYDDDIQPRITDPQQGDGSGPSPLARNPPLYYAYEGIPYTVFGGASLFDRLIAMRLATVLLYVLAVLFTWLLATEIFGRARRLQVVTATAVTALWPMMSFMGASVNPDMGLTTAYTLTALLGVRLVTRGPTFARVLGLCVAGAATMLVHGRGSPAALVVAVAILVAWIRFRPGWKRVVAWSAAGGAAAIVLLLASRVTKASEGAGGGGLYGDEAKLGSAFSIKQFIGQTWQFYFDRLSFMSPRLGPDYGYRQVVIERWVVGIFGGLEITYPMWVYDVAQVAVALLLLAAWTTAFLHRDQLRRALPVLAVLGTLAGGLMLLLHAAAYRALLTGPDPLVTGRYLLPLTPLAAIALAWLAGELPRRARGYAAASLVAVLLLLQLGGLGMTLIRFHA